MDVSVILVNYNTCQVTQACIESLRSHTEGVDYEIIVVDNASTDGSRETLGALPGIRYVYNEQNLGFGRANNAGAAVAQGDYLFFLNSDTLVTTNVLRQFLNYSRSQGDDLGAVGCVMHGPDGNTCHSYGDFQTLGGEFRDLVTRYLRFLRKDTNHPATISAPRQVGFVSGADLWVPRRVYDQTGGFDKDFFMYCEEMEWQLRMAARGLRRVVIPGPGIVHLEGGSDKPTQRFWSARRLGFLLDSKRLYARKHYSRPGYLCHRIINKLLQAPILLAVPTLTWGEKKALIGKL